VLAARVGEYMRMAAGEAKRRTSWTRGDEPFERALDDVVRRLVVEPEGAAFRDALGAMVVRVARPGMWNALARTLVHLGAPGVPDIYQGDELWNLALVDPDNRRPVDYALRERAMDALDQAERAAGPLALARALIASPEDGRVKLHLMRRALMLRREYPDLFALGDYRPLAATELGARHAIAFARTHEGSAIVVVAPRLTVALRGVERAPVGDVWRSSAIELPRELASMRWRDAFTGVRHEAASSLSLARVLAEWPVALLASEARAREG
jgi:(1->4)-alpha-D-glucan 1-alpha-D-glucosylmutase